MKKILGVLCVTLPIGPALLGAPLYDIAPTAKRVATIETAKSLLLTQPAPALPDIATLNNPFSPVGFDAPDPVVEKPAEPVVQAVASGRDLLNSIAPLVQPSGTVMVGGKPILIIGQKKLKVGDKLPIVFADKTYEVVIAAIERTSFTIRLRGEEITRPIKASNTP